MRKIKLSKGKYALVDSDMYEYLYQWNWYYAEDSSRKDNGGAARVKLEDGKRIPISMHRLIMGCSFGDGLKVDHIDGNRLNNQRYNLRIATNMQNCHNQRKPSSNTSGYKGVSFCKLTGKWRAYITRDYKKIFLGLFTSKLEAARTYDKWALELHGEFARLNFPTVESSQ